MALFTKNLELIRRTAGISQDKFCSTKKPKWDDIDPFDYNDVTKFGKKIDGVLRISNATYNNYMEGKTSPNEDVKQMILDDVNELRKRHPVLQKLFRKPLTLNQLFEEDLIKYEDISETGQLFSEKFLKPYLCYYTSTKVTGEKKTKTGILHLTRGNKDNEFDATGIFSFKDDEGAKKVLSSLQNGIPLKEALADCHEGIVFKGTAFLSLTLLWCNLSNQGDTEHATFSFDLSPKITTKNPDKTFMGAKGIALSQTSGQTNQTISFPIVIASEPLTVSDNELKQFLCFDYGFRGDKLDTLATDTVQLMNDLLGNVNIDEPLRIKLISQLVEYKLKEFLSQYTYGSNVFSQEALEQFYSTVIKPLRNSGEKDEPRTDD